MSPGLTSCLIQRTQANGHEQSPRRLCERTATKGIHTAHTKDHGYARGREGLEVDIVNRHGRRCEVGRHHKVPETLGQPQNNNNGKVLVAKRDALPRVRSHGRSNKFLGGGMCTIEQDGRGGAERNEQTTTIRALANTPPWPTFNVVRHSRAFLWRWMVTHFHACAETLSSIGVLRGARKNRAVSVRSRRFYCRAMHMLHRMCVGIP